MSLIGNLVTGIAQAAQDLVSTFFIPSPPSPVAQQQRRRTLSFDLVRADDLLVLRIDGYNLRLDEATRRLHADESGDAFLVVSFPPQAVAERAFLEGDSDDPLLPPPVAARLAGESRLVFHLAPAGLPLDFTAEAILAALSASAPLVGDRTGRPPNGAAPGGHAWFGGLRSQRSAIEAPWRLILSPHPSGRWAHAPSPVSDGNRVEMWHSRFGVAGVTAGTVDEIAATKRTVRAIHSPDFAVADGPTPTSGPSPFLMSLTRQDRHEIVRLSSERSLAGNAAVAVRRMMLSSLGASLELDGRWNTDEISLVEWQQLATLGRDQFVKTVRKGFLFPFGHRAALFTITERKLATGSRNVMVGNGQNSPGSHAYLRQRKFIVVREPIKRYSHRAFPFRSLEMRTRITPNILPETTDLVLPPGGPDAAFWPRFSPGGETLDILFEVEGIDWQGMASRFSAPLIFAFDSAIAQPNEDAIVAAYNGAAGPVPPTADASVRRTRPLGGQRVAFAPQQTPGDTAIDTDSVILAALNANGTPPFLPALRGATVSIPAVREITGSAAPQLIRYDDGFLAASSDTFGNAGEVFARIEAPPAIGFPVEKVGGLVAPDLTPQGLSRQFGPVGDVGAFAGGSFNPAAIFAGVKILGGVPLDKIFKLINFSWPSQAGTRIPGLTSVRTERDLGSGPEPVIETRYVWEASQAELQQQPIFTPLPGGQFRLDSRIVTPIDGGDPSFDVSGKLEKFLITLPPGDDALIGARFDHVRFDAGSGRKLDVSVNFDDIVFLGPLSFVDTIRRYIPLDGFIDPPYLDVTAEGVSSGFTLGLPTIGIGIFVLQDISLSAGFHLPFIGGAAGLRFAFCERDHPFLLTVMAFGGGGYFGIDLDTSQVTNVEAALEFGAAIALNLGVASGKASITGGVYYQKSGAGFEITAYFRAAGSLSVLGIVTVSVELYVGLGYQSDKAKPHGGKLYGTASIKVKIKIAFFSTSVSVGIEREFAGSDPTFAQMVTLDDWSTYCGAFAPEPA